jgi:hypothetical protein
MCDRYEQDVEYLTANPGLISHAWGSPQPGVEGGSLFRFAVNEERPGAPYIRGRRSGCLTMLRVMDSSYAAETPELEAAIRADKRIPRRTADIRPHHLPIFAAWQRRIDRELGRKPFPLHPLLPLPKAEFPIDDAFVNDPAAPKERNYRRLATAVGVGMILLTSLLVLA